MNRLLFNIMLLSIILAMTTVWAGNETRTEANNDRASQVQEDEQPLYQRVYFFQHQMIVRWLFESDGEFFSDMIKGRTDQLIEAAADIVNSEFAAGINVTPLPDKNAISISFPEPDSMPNCYFALILKEDQGYSYYVYERSIFSTEENPVGVVGRWTEEGRHFNLGSRDFTTEQAFIADILESRGR